jgi:hypothetical protein
MLLITVGALHQANASVGNLANSMVVNDWKDTIAAVVLNDRLFTVEKSGFLYETDLSTGKWVQVGKAEFGKTRLLFAGDKNLLSIESDGSLYRISPTDGSWTQLGKAGDWKGSLAGAFVNGKLYTVESSGFMYVTNASTGVWAQVGKADFANTQRLFSTSDSLYSIEKDGTLYGISPADGSWRQIGVAGGWKNTIARTTLGGKIYTVETSGALYETNPATGAWRQIGKTEFAKTRFLFSAKGSLYSIEDGNIYKINPSTGAWVSLV